MGADIDAAVHHEQRAASHQEPQLGHFCQANGQINPSPISSAATAWLLQSTTNSTLICRRRCQPTSQSQLAPLSAMEDKICHCWCLTEAHHRASPSKWHRHRFAAACEFQGAVWCHSPGRLGRAQSTQQALTSLAHDSGCSGLTGFSNLLRCCPGWFCRHTALQWSMYCLRSTRQSPAQTGA